MELFDERTLYVLIEVLGAIFILFSGKWMPFPFGLIFGLILIVFGGLKYRELSKKKK